MQPRSRACTRDDASIKRLISGVARFARHATRVARFMNRGKMAGIRPEPGRGLNQADNRATFTANAG